MTLALRHSNFDVTASRFLTCLLTASVETPVSPISVFQPGADKSSASAMHEQRRVFALHPEALQLHGTRQVSTRWC